MEIEKKQKQDDLTIVKISGNIDMSSCMSLRDVLLDCVKSKVKIILLNLEKVDYMDSSGLATLVEAYQQLLGYGGNLKLAGLKPAVKELIHLAKMDQIFQVFDTVEDAIK
ncbi:STAS domain-containing protein [Candidatus Riflebacteria bacterium]